MFGVILFGQILEDTAGFEKADLLAVAESIGQGGDAAVGVDFQEPAKKLLVSGVWSDANTKTYGSFWVFLEISIFSTL